MGTVIIAAVVVLVIGGSAVLGIAASWNRQHDSEDYFLAGRSLPWPIVALSIAGPALRLETWLGMIGLVYMFGVAGVSLALANFLGVSLLAWLLLPYLIRKRLFSPAEYLQRRYSPATRGAFAAIAIVGMLVGMLAPAFYLAGWALCEAGLGIAVHGFSWPLVACIAAVAVATAVYTVSGGLMAGAWSGAMQTLVVITGAIVLAVVSTHDVGGLSSIFHGNEGAPLAIFSERTSGQMQLSCVGLIAFMFTTAVWNAGVNPAIVQRCLGARSEWDAKMAVVAAGLLQLLLSAAIVIPGLAAFVKLGPMTTTGLSFDRASLELIDRLLGRETMLGSLGQGLVVAAVVAAAMSAASCVINSVSALSAMDIGQDLLHRNDSEAGLVRRGRRASAIAIVLGACFAPVLAFWDKGVLDFVLEVAAVIGPPSVVVFVVGLCWPRAHGRAAIVTLALGVVLGLVMWGLAANALEAPAWFKSTLDRAGLNGIACLLVIGLTTFAIPQNADDLYDPDTHWTLEWSRLSQDSMPGGRRMLVAGWALLIVATITLWIVFR